MGFEKRPAAESDEGPHFKSARTEGARKAAELTEGHDDKRSSVNLIPEDNFEFDIRLRSASKAARNGPKPPGWLEEEMKNLSIADFDKNVDPSVPELRSAHAARDAPQH